MPPPNRNDERRLRFFNVVKDIVQTYKSINPEFLEVLAEIRNGWPNGSGREDPPVGSATLTFGGGTTITITVKVEPDVSGQRHDYHLYAAQPPPTAGDAGTELATTTQQPVNDLISGVLTGYDANKTVSVKLTYRDGNPPAKVYTTAFPASVATGTNKTLTPVP